MAVPKAHLQGPKELILIHLWLAQPVVLERIPSAEASKPGGGCTWVHTKALYRLTQESQAIMKGCSDEMCSTSAMLTGVRVSDWIEED